MNDSYVKLCKLFNLRNLDIRNADIQNINDIYVDFSHYLNQAIDKKNTDYDVAYGAFDGFFKDLHSIGVTNKHKLHIFFNGIPSFIEMINQSKKSYMVVDAMTGGSKWNKFKLCWGSFFMEKIIKIFDEIKKIQKDLNLNIQYLDSEDHNDAITKIWKKINEQNNSAYIITSNKYALFVSLKQNKNKTIFLKTDIYEINLKEIISKINMEFTNIDNFLKKFTMMCNTYNRTIFSTYDLDKLKTLDIDIYDIDDTDANTKYDSIVWFLNRYAFEKYMDLSEQKYTAALYEDKLYTPKYLHKPYNPINNSKKKENIKYPVFINPFTYTHIFYIYVVCNANKKLIEDVLIKKGSSEEEYEKLVSKFEKEKANFLSAGLWLPGEEYSLAKS